MDSGREHQRLKWAPPPLYVLWVAVHFAHNAIVRRALEWGKEKNISKLRAVDSHLKPAENLVKELAGLSGALPVFNVDSAGSRVREAHVAFLDLERRYAQDVCGALHRLRDAVAAGELDRARYIADAIGKTYRLLTYTAGLVLDNIGTRLRTNEELLNDGDPVVRTVVSVDLCRYSEHAHLAYQLSGATGVLRFNEKIQTLINEALDPSDDAPGSTFVTGLGDGALIVFPTCASAWQFARELQERAAESAVAGAKNPMVFRVGIATGEIALKLRLQMGHVVGFEMAGMPIVNAVRLQSSCAESGVFICPQTYKGLPKRHKSLFAGPKRIQPKEHDHPLQAYRWRRAGHP